MRRSYHPRHNPDVIKELQQIKLEESFQGIVADGKMSPAYAHFLATHPQEYRNWRESEEDMRRFNF